MARSRLVSLVLAAAMAAFLPMIARAARGFYIGTGIGAAVESFSGDVTDISPDSGFNDELIHLGYNFTDQWGIGLQWGVAEGVTDNFLGANTLWGQGYFTFSGRYSFDKGQNFIPYVEAGLGDYVFLLMGDDGQFTSDPALGYRFAVGGQYYIGRFYISPELAYHIVSYDEGNFDLDRRVFRGYPTSFKSDFNTGGNMLVIQFKVGYHWRQVK